MITTSTPKAIRRLLQAALVTVALSGALAASAHAGSYAVTDPGAWVPGNSNPSVLTTYPENGLVARNVVVPGGSAPRGASANWQLIAPGRSTIGGYSFGLVDLAGAGSWSVLAESPPGILSFRCGAIAGGAACPASTGVSGSGGGNTLTAMVRCDDSSCPLDPIRGRFRLVEPNVSINNNEPPSSVSIVGGTAANGQWVGDQATVEVMAIDDVGIRSIETLVDGNPAGDGSNPDCVPGRLVPCTNVSGLKAGVDLRGLKDGVHKLQARAIDSAQNPNISAVREIKVDNTPPGKAEKVTIDGGPGWRATNAFTVRWTNPAQEFAPIVGAEYQLCPAGSTTGCVNGTADGDNVQSLENLQVPGAGNWTLQLALRDAAGNVSLGPDTAVSTGGLGFDDSPPTVSVAAIDPRDPARVVATGSDAQSGIKAGTIEVRRRGARNWRKVTASVNANTISGRLPDRRLPRGTYRVRVLAINAAGLTGGAQLAKPVKFPIRQRSRLTGGRPTGNKLKRVTSPRIGQRIKLRGRLTVKSKPLGRREIRILARTHLQGAAFRYARSVRTDKRGRYTIKLASGPARTVRLAFAGGARIADDHVDIQVRTRARVGLRLSSRRVRNGDTVTLSGRVRGGQLPPGGVQLAVQVLQRGKWQPFGTPVSDAQGRFRFDRRFETVADTTRFKFRAVVLKNPTYPFYGRSPARTITVLGAGG